MSRIENRIYSNKILSHEKNKCNEKKLKRSRTHEIE